MAKDRDLSRTTTRRPMGRDVVAWSAGGPVQPSQVQDMLARHLGGTGDPS